VSGAILLATLRATIGFAPVYISDVIAARTRVANQGAGLARAVVAIEAIKPGPTSRPGRLTSP
jgi:hypothetical protein